MDNHAGAHWQNGWLQSIRHTPSPNFSPRETGETVSLIVLHNISLPPFEYGTDAVEKLFANRLDPDGHPFFSLIHFARVQPFPDCTRRRNGAVRIMRRHGVPRRRILVSGAGEVQRVFHRHRTGRLRFRTVCRSAIPFARNAVGSPLPPLPHHGGNGTPRHRTRPQNRPRPFFRLAADTGKRVSRGQKCRLKTTDFRRHFGKFPLISTHCCQTLQFSL